MNSTPRAPFSLWPPRTQLRTDSGGAALPRDVVERTDRGAGHRTDRVEHASVVLLEERLRRSSGHQGSQLGCAGDHQQAVQLAHLATAGGVRLAVTALKKVRA